VSTLEAGYRSALRWYPRSWRRANGDALIGTLLDVAEAGGRTAPTASERRDLAVAGLRLRVGALLPETVRDRASALAIGLAAGLSLVLIFGQWWAPFGFGPYPKPDHIVYQVLPFYGLWIAAAGAALLGWPIVARVVAALTVPAGLFAMNVPDGDFLYRPSLLTYLFFVGLAVIALLGDPVRMRRRRAVAIAVGSGVAIALGWFWLYRPQGPWSLTFPRGSMMELVVSPIAAIAVLVGVSLLLVVRRPLWSAALVIVGIPWFGGAMVPLVWGASLQISDSQQIDTRIPMVVGAVLIAVLAVIVANAIARPDTRYGPENADGAVAGGDLQQRPRVR